MIHPCRAKGARDRVHIATWHRQPPEMKFIVSALLMCDLTTHRRLHEQNNSGSNGSLKKISQLTGRNISRNLEFALETPGLRWLAKHENTAINGNERKAFVIQP